MSVGSWINSVAGLARKIPGWAWLAVGLLLVAVLWLHQHDVRILQQAQLQQLQQQTSARVAALKKQAEQDIAKANVENAQAIQKLEARRQQIEQQNRQLAAQLSALRKQEQVQVGQVATLPISEIVTRVAAQLGLQTEDVVDGSHGTGFRAVGSSTDIAQNATSVPPAPSNGRRPNHPPSATGSHGTGIGAVGLSTPANPRHETDVVAAGATSGGEDTAATKAVAMALTGSGARKVEAALVELKACRAENDVESRQVTNCQARAQADDAVIQRQAGSIASLNQALKAKDKILNQQATACKAELRAVRGTFWGRMVRAARHVAIGVAIGLAIGVAAR